MNANTTTLVDQLNSYEGDNIWQDVICDYDLDEAAIEAADPGAASNVVVLSDGTTIRHDARTGQWA